MKSPAETGAALAQSPEAKPAELDVMPHVAQPQRRKSMVAMTVWLAVLLALIALLLWWLMA